MRIIIDGCDGTGKSVLANYLSKKLNKEIVDFGPPKTKNPGKEWLEYYTPGNKKFIDDVILDRSWISEMIYGPIFKRKKLTNKEIKKFLELTKDDVYIICHSDIEQIAKVFKTRGEDYINIEQAEIINNNFFDFLLKNISKNKKWKYYNYMLYGDLDVFYTKYIKNLLLTK